MPRRPSNHIDSPKRFGERLRQARLEAGLSQVALASEGCTAAYISRVEHGERTPSLQIIERWASQLDVDSSWLATGKEPDIVCRVQNLVAELARLYRPEALNEALAAYERQLSEQIERRRAQVDEKLSIIDNLRAVLEEHGVPDAEIAENLRLPAEALGLPEAG